MNIEELVIKIQEKLELAKGLKNIKIHIQDFDNKEDNSYIEFVVQDKIAERRSLKLYSKWSKIVRLNCPGISIIYDTPHALHNNNLKRIKVQINNTENINEKKEALNNAALCFYQILKDGIKYQK